MLLTNITTRFNYQQTIVHQLTLLLLDNLTWDAFWSQALPLAAQALTADHLHVWRSPDDERPFTCTFSLNNPSPMAELSGSVIESLLAEKRPLLLSAPPAELAPPASHAIIAPLPPIDGERYFLCFYAYEPFSQPESDQQLAGQIATLLALEIRQSRHLATRQMLTNALEQTADMVLITDRQGRIEYVNHAFTAVTGYSRAETLGKTPAILKSGYHPPQYYESLWQTILSGQTAHLIMVNRRKNGEQYYEDRTISPLLNEQGEVTHFIANGRDITEQRQAQLALQQSDAFNRAILNSLPAHIVVLDESGQIITTNEAWQQFGRENGIEDLAKIGNGVNYLEICRQATGPNSNDALITYDGLTAVLAGRATRFDQEYPCHSPTQDRWYLLRAVPLRDGSGRIIVTHTDITQNKLLERQMQTVYQFGQELAFLQSEPEILHLFLDNILGLLGVDMVRCGLIDEARQELVYAHWTSDSSVEHKPIRFALDGNVSVGIAAIKQRTPLYVPHVDQESKYIPASDFPARSAYCVPVFAAEKVIGVITAESRRPDGFTSDDRRFLNISAQQLGLALHNARLFALEQQQARNLTLLYQASRTIASSLDLSQVLNALLHEIKTLLSAHTASTLLYDAEQDHLYFAAIAGGQLDSLSHVVVWPDQSIAGWVFRHQQAVLIDDAQLDPRFFDLVDDLTGWRTHALLAVPLTIGDQKLGVVEVLSDQPGIFTPDQLALLESLSAGAAIAIENARLFAAERQLKEHLQQSQARLIQSEKLGALGRLTASIAHEINNPLQSVQGFITLITEAIPPADILPKPHQYLKIVDGEVERIAQLIKQMRDFYRPSQQEMAPTDVHEVLESILTLSRQQIQYHNVRVEQDWWAELPPVWGNPDHLKQVFLNLLLNALDAMPNGGVLQIKTGLGSWPGVGSVQPAVRIDFVDTGPGIPPEIGERLFEPFVTTKLSGTGLGLSISYNIVEAHGGTMLVESSASGGTSMSVLLPLVVDR